MVLDTWKLGQPIPVEALRGAPLEGGPFTFYKVTNGKDVAAEPGEPGEEMRAQLLDWLAKQRSTLSLGEFERLEPTDELIETLQKKGYW